MEQINTIQLGDPAIFPDESVLEKVLGRSFSAYKKLLKLFEENQITYEWKYYRDGKAWLCKVQKKTKTIIWMSAWDGYVKATIYIPEKYINGIYELDIPEEEKERIKNTKNVGKSKPCSFDIRSQKVIALLEKVMKYKIELK